MHHSRRKSFDWYGLKQHFSIRKYHFGAASVLLGMSIALGTGTQVVQAAETVTTPESTSVASSTSATESTTSETSTETATSSSSERTVEIGYIVKYATEDGTLVNASVETVSVTTTETIAKATVSVTAVVPEGYELAAGQAATVSQEVTENGQNIVTVKVVKKVEASATVSSPTTTSTTVATASSTTRAAASPTPTTPTTPTTVEEAKKVLEQVTSEAEVLANETNRLVAADNTNEVLKTAAAATKLVATKATVTFQNAFATLEEVNAQISAVRTSVEALVLELRKFLGTDVIDIALTTVTDMNDSTNRPGYWTENEEVLNKAAATATATTKPQKQNIPAGYEVDPTDGRITFLIYSLSADDVDATVTPGTKDGSYNKRYGTDYYITLSMDRVPSTGNIYARLVSKQKGFIEEIEIPENTARHQFQKIANGPKELGEFTYRMSLTTMPFTDSTGQQTSVRYANINSGVGANGKGSVAYSLLTSDRTSYNSYTGMAPSYLPIQVTSYYVKETERRAQELLASYAHVAMVSGDSFTISDAAEFANYELIEAPVIKDAPVSTNYSVGTPLIQYFPASKTARVIYVAKEDGTARFLNFVLNPDHPDFLENFKNYHSMSAVDFVTNGGAEALDFTNRIAIVNKYLAEIEAVNADTSLTSDQQASRLAEIRANYASEINTDDNKFLLTFVSTEAEPLSANDGPDAVTGLTTWTHTVKNYYTLYSGGKLATTIALQIGAYLSDPMVDWAPTAPTPQGAKLHSKTEVDKDGIAARVNITVNDNGVEKEVGADLHSNIIAMYNMLTANENNQHYYYAEKGGVKVYYVDTEGNVLQDSKSIYDHANTNTAYDTKSVKDATITTADGTVYYYKEIDTADLRPASSNTDTEKRKIEKITEEVGTVAQDTLKELTYVYEKAGNVNVNYVDVDGNKLSGTDGTGKVVTEKVADLVNAKAGTGYDTIVDNRPAKIVTADGKTYELAPAAEYTVGTVEADHHLSVSNVTEVTGVHEATGSVASGITKEITFVYKEVTGKVIVHYVDQDGNPISGTTDEGKKTASTVTDTPESSTGTPYDTKDLKPKTIATDDGKIYKLVPAATQGNETGKVVVGTTEITYVYELVQGDVIVHYVDTEGNTIADDVTDQTITDTGTDYDTRDNKPEKITNDQTGEVYYILPKDEVKAGDKETGKVVEGTTEVTYIYQKAGSVNVNYVDTEGKVLKTKVADVTDGKPGSGYDTVLDNKLASISVDGKLYRLAPAGTYNVGTVSGDNNLTAVGNGKATGIDATTGTVEAGTTKEITYVYQEVKGDVVVEYYDTEGNQIAKTVVDEEDKSVGTVYNTDEDNKPETITTEDGTVYYYKEVKDTSAPTTGKVAETTTTVQYVYEKAGSVNVNYVDVNGTEIKADVLDVENGKPGSDYDTLVDNRPDTIVAKDGKTYKLVPAGDYPVGTVAADSNLASDDTPTGTVEAGVTKEVTYVYKEVKGNVIVHYVDTEGKPISGTTDDGKQTESTVEDTPESSTGTPYDTKDNKPTTITTEDGKNYKLVPAATIGKEDGEVVEGTTEVTYVYELLQGDVIVHYVDTEGNTIADDVTDQVITDTGTDYDTKDNKPEKIVNDETGDVYYILPKDEVKAGDKETGKVVEGTTEVTYIYEKAGSVNVNYVDTEGNPIQAPVADETNEKAGTEYATADNKPTTITTADGKTYRLVEAGTYNVGTVSDDNNLTAVGNGKATGIDATTGTVEAGTTKEITYVYEEVKGNVVVNYITTDGTVIKQPVEDTPTSSTGTPYDTKDNKPTTITTENGKTYRIVPVLTKGSETGKVVEGTTSITYVYEEVKGDVVVEYYDTEGNLISGLSDSGEAVDTKEVDTPSTSTGTAYNTDEDHKPNTITTADGTVYYYKEVKDTSASTIGKVVEGTTTVQYVYEKAGNVIVHYITEDGTVIKATVTDEENAEPGKSYTTTDNKPTTITTEDGSRYVLIPSKTIGSETGTVEGGKTIEITYVYKKVANWIPQIPGVPEGQEPKVPYPFDPTNPDVPVTPTPDTVIPNVPGYTPVDPKTNEPLKPVDPTDPGKGYVPPTPDETGVDTPIPYVQNGNVVVNYVTEDGTVIKAPIKDETDAPAGKSYDATDNKPVEIVTEDGSRYVLIPSKTVGSETGTVEGGKTTEITYVYKKVANWIPQIPGVPAGEEPKVPYPFDPENPDKPIDPTTPGTNGEVPSIPYVPGYTPVDPKTDKPLKPIDPTDPSKGYVPPTPDETGVDTPIPYVQNGNVVVNYVDENGNVLKTPVNDETDAPAGKSYDTTDNKPTEIVTEDGSRYVLIPSKIVGSETGTVEGGKTTEITYVYKKVANWIPQIPGVPAGEEPKVPYPFDPTTPDKPIDPTTPYPDGEVPSIPNVPGYTPVDPKTNEPLKPVDPTDPSKGYVPPTPDETGVDTPIPYVQNGNVVVNYVDENGNVLKTPVNDETDAPAGKSYDTTDNKPTEIVTEDGSRYVLIPSKTIGTENGTVEGGKTIEITYVYKKVANWIPQIPGVPEGQEPKVPYPFDPTNPDVPVTPTPDTVIPNVPGYTPVDPKTNEPLKPVDPTDPGKGYVPPTPDETGVDTPIPYVQTGNVVVNYVDENGNVLKTPVNDETDAPAGKSYDTTDNKPNTITTEDGTTYELVRVEGSETGTVVGGKTTEVTYVYRKVETPAKKVVTNHVDEDGNPIAPQEEGTTPNKSIPGYEFTGKTVTDPDGNTTHIYRKVSKPVAPKPQAPVAPTTAKAGAAQLPNTGEASSSATVLGAGMLIAALALAGKRRRNED
ncbi:YSIRK-type signal peptide-containing protein [Streptococcus suis]|uniref:YSIRK-type signal peptide-containing protein n=3 Tax=Streptococcus suis TaxID=1307 RepID=A0A426G1G1_STRSU|nr:MucBP domain-containing protein [Streptococcus suis]RRN48883.1 YSIRK-type signal peptide-containing protein [Streptococcus suis]